MRLLRLNPLVLALIFSALIEGIGIAIYDWLGSTYGTGTFTDFWCGSFLFLHKPAAGLTKLFFPADQWPGIGAHIVFEVFSLIEWWIISLVSILIFRGLYRKFDERNRAVENIAEKSYNNS